MESKNSVVSWNLSAMSKQVSPLSTPMTASHSGVDFLATVPIAHSRIKRKRSQYIIKQTQYSSVFDRTKTNNCVNCEV